MRHLSKILRFAASAALLPLALSHAPIAAATVTSISLSGVSCELDANGTQLTCSPTGTVTPPPTGGTGEPSGCVLSSLSGPTVTVGTPFSLRVTCSGGAAPTSYKWSGAGANCTFDPVSTGAGASTLVVTLSAAACPTGGSATFAAAVSNASSTGSGTPTNDLTLTVNAATTPPPPPPVTSIVCNAPHTGTKVIEGAIPANGGSQRYDSSGIAFKAADALVFQFTAPSGADPIFTVGFVQTGASPGGQSSQRTVVLSSQPCDFDPASKYIVSSQQISTGTMKLSTVAGNGYKYVVAGQKYYYNISNFVSGVQRCPATTCNVVITVDNPNP